MIEDDARLALQAMYYAFGRKFEPGTHDAVDMARAVLIRPKQPASPVNLVDCGECPSYTHGCKERCIRARAKSDEPDGEGSEL